MPGLSDEQINTLIGAGMETSKNYHGEINLRITAKSEDEAAEMLARVARLISSFSVTTNGADVASCYLVKERHVAL